MKIIKADDYQSWYIENSNKSILIDPWLSNQMQPSNSFFIQRFSDISHKIDNESIKKINCVILTAPFEDHLNLETLKSLPSDIPIYTTKFIKFLIKKKVKNPIRVFAKEGLIINDLKIVSVPTGFPYSGSTIALLIKDKIGNKVFHEGHVVNLGFIKKNSIKADTAILTVDQTRLLGFIKLGMNEQKVLEACNYLECKNLFITGNNPEDTEGFISNFLTVKKTNMNKINKKVNVFSRAGATLDIST